MANRIQGITVEIGGDTTKFSNALKTVNSSIKTTQTQLKDVEKLLKIQSLENNSCHGDIGGIVMLEKWRI